MTDPVATDPSTKSGRGGNLLTHGAFSAAVLLPGEARAEYDRQLQALRDEWKPDGLSEEAAVNSLHRWLWAEQRIIAELNLIYERLKDRSQRAAAIIATIQVAKSLKGVREAVAADPEVRKGLRYTGTMVEILRAQKDRNLDNAKRRQIEALEQYAAGTSDVDPGEDLERQLNLFERIAAFRTREFKNLIQVKAMKQALQFGNPRTQQSPASSPKAIAHRPS